MRASLVPLKIDFPRASDRNTACANQSASQNCRLATNQRPKSADLRQKKNKQTKDSAPGLWPAWGQVTRNICTTFAVGNYTGGSIILSSGGQSGLL